MLPGLRPRALCIQTLVASAPVWTLVLPSLADRTTVPPWNLCSARECLVSFCLVLRTGRQFCSLADLAHLSCQLGNKLHDVARVKCGDMDRTRGQWGSCQSREHSDDQKTVVVCGLRLFAAFFLALLNPFRHRSCSHNLLTRHFVPIASPITTKLLHPPRKGAIYCLSEASPRTTKLCPLCRFLFS